MLLLLSISAISHASCVKSLRWYEDPPYSFLEHKGQQKVSGIDIELTRMVLNHMGCDMALLQLPWARALKELEQGRVDLLSGVYKTAERQEFAHFIPSKLYSPNVLFLRRDFQGADELHGLGSAFERGLQLGAQLDVYYGEDFKVVQSDKRFKHQIHYLSDRQSIWKMLAHNRLDGIIVDKLTADYEILSLGLQDKVMASGIIVSDNPAYYAFSQKTTSEAFVKRFEQALQEVSQSQAFYDILQRYGSATSSSQRVALN